MPHDTYAAARNAEYTFPSPLYVSLIAACVDSRVCTKRDGTGGINFCRCGYISVPSSFVRLSVENVLHLGGGGVTSETQLWVQYQNIYAIRETH